MEIMEEKVGYMGIMEQANEASISNPAPSCSRHIQAQPASLDVDVQYDTTSIPAVKKADASRDNGKENGNCCITGYILGL